MPGELLRLFISTTHSRLTALYKWWRGVVCRSLGAVYFSSGRAGNLDIDVKVYLSAPTTSRALTLLGVILSGCATGVLWPVNIFVLKFSVGFIGTLSAILIIAGLVWGACAFYVLVCHPLIRLFKLRNFVRPHVTQDVVAPILAAKPTRDEVSEGKWVGVAVLIGVAALWFILVGWAILSGPNPLIVFSGWGAGGCAAAGFGLNVIAGAYDNDDVGTFALVVAIAGALFTTLILAALSASI
jgi:hypothetical protein